MLEEFGGGTNSNGNKVLNITVLNSTIEGSTDVGGVAGASGYNSNPINNVRVKDCYVIGNGEKIGGIFGSGGQMVNGLVEDSSIIANNVNSANIGGLAGALSWNIQRSGIVNSQITSLGNGVGGILGKGSELVMTFSINTNIEGNEKVGGITGSTQKGTLSRSYSNANIKGNRYVGGMIGYMDNLTMDNLNNIIRIEDSYYANGTITGKQNVGGIVGGLAKELYTQEGVNYYKGNYVQADINSEDKETISLGIASNKEENKKLVNTYYYKYSKVNGINPNIENEPEISEENYLAEEELKQQDTYISKLTWIKSHWNFDMLNNSKYPTINEKEIPNQEGLPLPVDAEHIVEDTEGISNITNKEETVEAISEYYGKIIETYATYSTITAKDRSTVKRNAKLYVKDNKLYAIPISISDNNDQNEKITPVANNLILDNYNGKEYATVLGSDGRIYDLKDSLHYPENFSNKDIESIGNNLDKAEKEIEVTYKNGDKLKFNYQTGEIIASRKNNTQPRSIIEYTKDKIKNRGKASYEKVEAKINDTYEESKELQTKLEIVPIEKAIETQNMENLEPKDNTLKDVNNSLMDKKYVSVYNQETEKYEIYTEDELLDTTQTDLVSENEKIEKNNLSSFYSSTKIINTNKNSGRLTIYIIILAIIIILAVLIRYNITKGRKKL